MFGKNPSSSAARFTLCRVSSEMLPTPRRITFETVILLTPTFAATSTSVTIFLALVSHVSPSVHA